MRTPNFNKTIINPDNDIYEGQSLEREIEIAETTKQPIETSAPQIFTPRKDGVQPQYNIRADRWEIALNAMDKVTGSYRAKRAEYIKTTQEGETTKGESTTTAQTNIGEA